jgi:hypothetical protein
MRHVMDLFTQESVFGLTPSCESSRLRESDRNLKISVTLFLQLIFSLSKREAGIHSWLELALEAAKQ